MKVINTEECQQGIQKTVVKESGLASESVMLALQSLRTTICKIIPRGQRAVIDLFVDTRSYRINVKGEGTTASLIVNILSDGTMKTEVPHDTATQDTPNNDGTFNTVDGAIQHVLNKYALNPQESELLQHLRSDIYNYLYEEQNVSITIYCRERKLCFLKVGKGTHDIIVNVHSDSGGIKLDIKVQSMGVWAEGGNFFTLRYKNFCTGMKGISDLLFALLKPMIDWAMEKCQKS